jgi:hypothetical protein
VAYTFIPTYTPPTFADEKDKVVDPEEEAADVAIWTRGVRRNVITDPSEITKGTVVWLIVTIVDVIAVI